MDASEGSLVTPTMAANFSMYEEPPWLQALFIVSYELVSLLGIIGNAVVCYIVLGHARMRTVTNYFIVNLAVSDLSMAVVCVTFTLYATLYGNWPFGNLMCKLVNYVQNVSVSVSIFTLVAIGLDRYVAIIYPLKPRMTGSLTLMIIMLTWTVSCLFALPSAVFPRTLEEDGIRYCTEGKWRFTHLYSLSCMVIQYFAPLSVLAIVYLRISIRIWSRRTPGEGEITRDRKLNESKRKLVKLFATVVLIFALCYLPIHVFNLIQDFRKEVLYFEYIKLVYLTCLLIAMSNCFVNPIIYCWMNTKFRNGFRQVFSFLPCVSTNPDWRGKRGISGREFVQTQMESVSYKSERTKSSSENNYSYITLQVVNNNHASGKGGTEW